VAAVLIITGIITWLSWKTPGQWKPDLKNMIALLAIMLVVFLSISLFQIRGNWEENYTRESNYYTIQVDTRANNVKMLRLDHLIHSYTNTKDPTVLTYDYLFIFEEIAAYLSRNNPAPSLLHLGGGGYTFPQYMEAIYPDSTNEVVEIDPVVTEVNYAELGLPRDTAIKTYNQDARLFMIQQKAEALRTGSVQARYDMIIGDVFSDRSTPYHLTTLEFDNLVKAALKKDGVYLINMVDDVKNGRYMPAFLNTLGRVFENVYLFGHGAKDGIATFVVMATDKELDVDDYTRFVTQDGARKQAGILYDEAGLSALMAGKKALLLTDDYAPTDILVAPLVR